MKIFYHTSVNCSEINELYYSLPLFFQFFRNFLNLTKFHEISRSFHQIPPNSTKFPLFKNVPIFPKFSSNFPRIFRNFPRNFAQKLFWLDNFELLGADLCGWRRFACGCLGARSLTERSAPRVVNFVSPQPLVANSEAVR